MIYHMSKEVARNRADTMPALPAVVNAAVAAKYDRADRGDADDADDADDDRGGAEADPADDDADRHHQEDGVLQSKEEERQLRRWRP